MSSISEREARDAATAAPGREESHRLRQTIVDALPDRNDPDSWPRENLNQLAGRLLGAHDVVEAAIRMAEAAGFPPEKLRVARHAIEDARQVLSTVESLSALAAWRTIHVPRLDPLDHVYDCCAADCPVTGFASPEDKQLHYVRWSFDHPDADYLR